MSQNHHRASYIKARSFLRKIVITIMPESLGGGNHNEAFMKAIQDEVVHTGDYMIGMWWTVMRPKTHAWDQFKQYSSDIFKSLISHIKMRG